MIKTRKVATFSIYGIQIEPGMENLPILQAYIASRSYFSVQEDLTYKILETLPGNLEIHESTNVETPIFTPVNLEKSVDNPMAKNPIVVKAVNRSGNIGKISWNPNIGVVDFEWNKHSPAMTLYHEMRHACHMTTNPVEYSNNKLHRSPEDSNMPIEEVVTIDECIAMSKKLSNNDGGNVIRRIRKTWGINKVFKAKSTTSNRYSWRE